jgi:predicted tellurium resistance membrane protein TerC
MADILPIIISLIVVEILLSLDNALVNAALADQFPKKERNRLIRVGILLGIVFRIVTLVLMAVIIKNIWLKFICGLYLIGISIKHIGRPVDRTGHLIKQTDSIKLALFQIAIADRVFSISNIFAISSFKATFQLIVIAVILGMISVTFAAPMFAKVIKRYKGMSQATFSIVGLLGVLMCLEAFFGTSISNITKTIVILGVVGFTILYEHSHKTKKLSTPFLRWLEYVVAIPLDVFYAVLKVLPLEKLTKIKRAFSFSKNRPH